MFTNLRKRNVNCLQRKNILYGKGVFSEFIWFTLVYQIAESWCFDIFTYLLLLSRKVHTVLLHSWILCLFPIKAAEFEQKYCEIKCYTTMCISVACHDHCLGDSDLKCFCKFRGRKEVTLAILISSLLLLSQVTMWAKFGYGVITEVFRGRKRYSFPFLLYILLLFGK